MTGARNRGAFLLVAALALPAVLRVDALSFQWRKVSNHAFRVGEVILYDIRYGGVPAGRASLEVKGIESEGGRTAYHIISRARTNKSLDQVFMVRDSNDSWIDVESICSTQFMQNIREGGYKKWTLTRFDHPAQSFKYTRKGKGTDDNFSGEIPPFVQDSLSAMYYLRTQDLRPGEEVRLDANSGGKTWPLKVLVKGIETVKVPAGTFECFRVEPVMSGEGIFVSKGRLEVWLTRDKRKIPVLMRSEVAVGAFEVQMKEYSVLGKRLREMEEGE